MQVLSLRAVTRAVATAGTIGVAGDALIQTQVERRLQYDWQRTGRMVAYRVLQAPIIESAWRSFDLMAARLRIVGARAVAFKIVADQLTLMPAFTATFFVIQALLEGEKMERALQRSSVAFWPTVILCGPYYSTVHIVTFGFLPVQHRLAWSSVCAVGWTAYISYANQKLIQEENLEIATKSANT